MLVELRSRFDVRAYTQTPWSAAELSNCVGGLRSDSTRCAIRIGRAQTWRSTFHVNMSYPEAFF